MSTNQISLKTLSLGLGIFSIGLGVAELFAGRRIAARLGVEDQTGVVRAFGARELLAGVGLLSGPAHSTRVWNRVAGDAMDITALALAGRRNPENADIKRAMAFVITATVLDIIVARRLDQTTGRVFT